MITKQQYQSALNQIRALHLNDAPSEGIINEIDRQKEIVKKYEKQVRHIEHKRSKKTDSRNIGIRSN